MTTTDPPTADLTRVSIVRDGKGHSIVLLTVTCPHCGKPHTHGAGDTIATSRTYLGPRSGRCARKDPTTTGGYILTDTHGLLP